MASRILVQHAVSVVRSAFAAKCAQIMAHCDGMPLNFALFRTPPLLRGQTVKAISSALSESARGLLDPPSALALTWVSVKCTDFSLILHLCTKRSFAEVGERVSPAAFALRLIHVTLCN